MCSKALLLLAAMLAVRCLGSGSSRRTLALACEDVDAMEEVENMYGDMGEAVVALENNRYSSNNNNNNNNYNNRNNDYNYNYATFGDVDGIADSNDNEQNNDNYNYNKASAKWQHQKLYGNPIHSIYDFSRSQPQPQLRQPEPELQLRREFDDDPENAGNDFRLQLSDLNAAVQGVGRFVVEHQHNPDPDQDNDNDNSSSSSSKNNGDSNSQPQQEELLLERRSRISRREPEAGQPEFYDNEYAAAAAASASDAAPDAHVDIEGEEDYAVAVNGQDENEDEDELSEQLPYGIQNVRKRRVRSVMPPAQQLLSPSPNSDEVTYQSLCPTNRVTVKLDSGDYRPNHYVEVTCAHNYAPQPPRVHNYDYVYRSNDLLRALLAERGEKREICSAIGFACIQLNRTIHLIRLNDASGCWESETRTVPSGCECMWPKHSYGDIGFYHQTQKRHGGVRGRVAPSIDYKPGVGYRQLTVRTRTPKAGQRSRREDLGYESYELN